MGNAYGVASGVAAAFVTVTLLLEEASAGVAKALSLDVALAEGAGKAPVGDAVAWHGVVSVNIFLSDKAGGLVADRNKGGVSVFDCFPPKIDSGTAISKVVR